MQRSGRVGIVAALAAEARTLGCAAPPREQLLLLPDGALLAVSGVGLQAAERDARALLDAGCSALVSWGLAGGLDPELAAGTVVLPEVSMLEGAPDLSTSSAWRARVLESLGRAAAGPPIAASGKLLSRARPVASTAEKRAAFVATGAIAVDMESYAIAQVAAARGLPFLAVRAIIDAAGDEVPPAFPGLAASAGGELAVGPLALGILSSPRTLAPLVRLARRFRVARRALRAAARAGAPGAAPDPLSTFLANGNP